ncbi:MAG: hypothetical protein ACFHU9_05475 [Fluviicola sp.]
MNKNYCRNIIFSKTPLKSCLKFEDQFQIYPLEFENAPKFDRATDIPLVIEYWIDEDEEVEISDEFESIKELMKSTTLQEKKRNRVTRLLSVVTNHWCFQYKEEGVKWGIPFPSDDLSEEEVNSQSAQPIIPIYSYPSLTSDLYISAFTEQTGPSPEFIPHSIYYVFDPVENSTGAITFPHTIFHTLDAYFKLDSNTQKKIDTICHLISCGLELENKMKSLAFVSFVSAIESLVSIDFKMKKGDVEIDCKRCQSIKSSPINCPDCGKPIWGISAKFKEFLKTYVATSDDSNKKFNRIYRLRSRIAHNGSLLIGDEFFDWSKSDKSDSDWKILLEAKQASRLAVVNWLLMNRNK